MQSSLVSWKKLRRNAISQVGDSACEKYLEIWDSSIEKRMISNFYKVIQTTKHTGTKTYI